MTSPDDTFTIYVKPGRDPLTHQLRESYPQENFIIQGTMKDPGLIVKKVDEININVEDGNKF